METIASRRRDSLTIIADILEAINAPIKPTHVLYRTNLSHPQLKKYMQLLVNMGFAQELEKPGHVFVVTAKGRAFMQLIEPCAGNDTHGVPAVPSMIKSQNLKVEDAKLRYNILTTVVGECE